MNAKPARQRFVGSPRIAATVAAILAGLLAAPAPVQAQTQTPQGAGNQGTPGQAGPGAPPVTTTARPYRGLFGAGSPAAPRGHLLDLTAAIYQEYGNLEDPVALAESLVLSNGWFLGVRGGLSFEKAGEQTRFGLRGDGSFRYYRDVRQTTSPRLRFGAGLDSKFGRRRKDSLSATGTVAYEPYYALPIFTSEAPLTGGTAILPTNRDDLLFRRPRYIYEQTFGLEHQLSARTYLRIAEEARYTQADTPGLDINSIRASAGYGYRVSPAASLRVGYSYQTGHYGPGQTERIEVQGADFSFEYRKALTPSRQTTFGFSTGSSRVTPQPDQPWTVAVSADLRHELAKGWFVQGDFVRNVRLVEGFADPFFENTATASVGGFMGRRVELLTSGGYSRGVVGFESDTYTAVQGSMRLRVALARFLAVDTEGLINRHEFDNRLAIPTVVPPILNRWAVRCRVSLWLPLSR